MRYIVKAISRPIRKFATETTDNCNHLDSWIKINREMRTEAREIVNNAIDQKTAQINHDISMIKSDIHGMKTDINGMKTDLSSRINRLENSMTDLYKQNTNSTRLILMGIFGVTSAAVGVNQYFEHERVKLHSSNINAAATGSR